MDQESGTSSSRARKPKAGLVVLLGVLVLIWFMVKSTEVEHLVPIEREARIALLTQLDRAEQVAGFPPHSRWLEPWVNPYANRDDPAIPFVMPWNGTVAFRDLRLHEDARLRFSYGFEYVPAEGAPPKEPDARVPAGKGTEVTFEVRAKRRDGGALHSLFRRASKAGDGDALPIRSAIEVAFPSDWIGARIDLEFRTESSSEMQDAFYTPSFGSPAILSRGEKARVGDLTQTVDVLVADLLDRFPQAIADDPGELLDDIVIEGHPDRVFAVKTSGGNINELLTIPVARVPAFDAGTKQEAERYGAWPALEFGLDGTLARFAVDVPSSGARFLCRIGVDRRSIGVGAATFEVTVDGESIYRQRLEPGASKADAGWRDVDLDLSRFGGRRVSLALSGSIEVFASRHMGAAETEPYGTTVPFELDVRRVQAAFAEPRVVERRTTSRRLAAKRDPPRPSVIVINVETLRADALGCYGAKEEVSPAIDRLAREGVRVDPCISVAPWTAPSVASVLTGLYPYSHGVISYAQNYLADSVDTLAEIAAREGVTTAAFVSNDLVSPRRNFDQGFETFLLAKHGNARQLVGAFEDWLEDNRDLQFFAYLHLFEPHDPCNAPGDDRERFVDPDVRGTDSREGLARIFDKIVKNEPPSPDDPDVRLLRGRYRGEIRYADRQIERLHALLLQKGLLGRVVVIVTGDHGEEFCEHGLIGHGKHCFEESVAVPLVIYGPGFVPAGTVIEGPVENTAIFATVLELLGVPFDAKAVEPALRFDGEAPGGSAYSSTEEGLRQILPELKAKTVHSLRTRSASFVFSPRGGENEPAECAAFDLVADPRELRDLSREPGFDLAPLKTALASAWRFARSQAHGIAVDSISDTVRGSLAQLGYVVGVRTNAAGALFADGEDCGK